MINISDVQKFSHLQLQIPSSRVVILTTDCLHVNNLLRRFYISNFKELKELCSFIPLTWRLQLSAIVKLSSLI